MTSYALTRKQLELYDFLRRELGQFPHPPSLDELCLALGVKSRGSLHKHIQALVDAELLAPLQKHRGIRLRDTEQDPSALPILGRIAAGKPIDAVIDERFISVPAQLRTRKPCFVLEVKGDSMIDDGILDGDWVVIEKREFARNGEIVVALIDGENVTLKRFEKKVDAIILHPANTTMQSQIYDAQRVTIQGVLVGQMRSYV